jgi:hypothetical protein
VSRVESNTCPMPKRGSILGLSVRELPNLQ